MNGDSTDYSEDTKKSSEKIMATASENKAESEDFWNLGKPKPKIYSKPNFDGHTIGVTDISDENSEKNDLGEKIPPKSEITASRDVRPHRTNTHTSSHVVKTVNGTRIVTDSYRHHSAKAARARIEAGRNMQASAKPSAVTASYGPTGDLILHIDVRTWETDTEFYGRFASDALKSHNSRALCAVGEKTEKVPYFSYVPQYSHMNLHQIEYYKQIRESIDEGKFPDCDLSYVLLYIYEIINLPNVIPAERGAELLAKIWLGYRKMHSRLDGYLCEWLPDYCMIRETALPRAVIEIMPEIVPKAQFKEFYFNIDTEVPRSSAKNVISSESSFIAAKTLIEVSSDYDFRTSKYYPENKAEYEALIPAALSWVMYDAKLKKRGIFSLERIYKMTRDSYCGAIASSGIKRRIDIEFCSFTRRADTRHAVTALVKYAENKLRAVLGIKAKLVVASPLAEDTAQIDRFFEQILPISAKKSKEDRYMPDDYLKNYESENSDFDFGTASEIEQNSWSNTAILTGDGDFDELYCEAEDEISIIGEITEHEMPQLHNVQPEKTPDESDSDKTDAQLHDGLESAINGSFREYCKEHGIHEGELADRINTVFLDIIGDVVLENSGHGFELIEDYREDVCNWLH